MKNFPYQFTNTNNLSTSLYISSSGKSVRNEAFTTYFPKQSFYTLHFVLEGEAEYIQDGKSHKISKNGLLVVFPGTFCELNVTKAPYINHWLNIKGSDLMHFLAYTDITSENPVFKMKKNLGNLFEKIYDIQGPLPYQQIEMLSVVYNILSLVTKESNNSKKPDYKGFYISRFVDFIENNYGKYIKVIDEE